MMMKKCLYIATLLVCLSSAAVCCLAHVDEYPSLVVRTDKGLISGQRLDMGVDQWIGIPYASPPIGNQRFADPIPASRWRGVLNTTIPKAICPQGTPLVGSEDCLYANIFAPTNRDNRRKLPVFVWIYGGSWTTGDGLTYGMYNGTSLAKLHPDKIVVTFNYRLGALGFLALPALKKESEEGGVGSYGIRDQIAFLKWVQRNIGAFGGDASAVTIGGESAGAFSVCIHAVSPLSKNLFKSIIMESGTCASGVWYNSLENSYAWSKSYSSAVSCDATALSNKQLLACMRSLNLEQVMSPNYAARYPSFRPTMWPIMPWGTTIDGRLLTDMPLDILQSGRANPIESVILGTNLDEGTLFVSGVLPYIIPGGMGLQLVQGDLERVLTHFFGNSSTIHEMVAANYPLDQFYYSENLRVNAVVRDFFFLCPTASAAAALSRKSSTYLYQFTHKSVLDPAKLAGAYHSVELGYVFNTTVRFGFTEQDKILVKAMGTYWSQLIKTSNPNGMQQLMWPKYKRDTLYHMNLDVPLVVENSLQKMQCAMWDRIGQYAPPVSV